MFRARQNVRNEEMLPKRCFSFASIAKIKKTLLVPGGEEDEQWSSNKLRAHNFRSIRFTKSIFLLYFISIDIMQLLFFD